MINLTCPSIVGIEGLLPIKTKGFVGQNSLREIECKNSKEQQMYRCCTNLNKTIKKKRSPNEEQQTQRGLKCKSLMDINLNNEN